MGWSIMCTHYMVETLGRNTTWMSSAAFMTLWGENERTFWAAGSLQLHLDKTPDHYKVLIETFVAYHNIIVLRRAQDSLGMAPCDVMVELWFLTVMGN